MFARLFDDEEVGQILLAIEDGDDCEVVKIKYQAPESLPFRFVVHEFALREGVTPQDLIYGVTKEMAVEYVKVDIADKIAALA